MIQELASHGKIHQTGKQLTGMTNNIDLTEWQPSTGIFYAILENHGYQISQHFYVPIKSCSTYLKETQMKLQ